MSKKIIIIWFVLIFIIGLCVGLFYEKFYPTGFSVQQERACWEQAKSRLENSGLIIKNSNQPEMKSVNGEITAINKDIITLKIQQFDLLSDPALDTRFIEIDGSTAISRVLVKEEQNVSSPSPMPSSTAISDISGSASGGFVVNPVGTKAATNLTVPQFEYQTINSNDLKIGDKISVLAETDIRNQKNIKAKNITIIPF